MAGSSLGPDSLDAVRAGADVKLEVEDGWIHVWQRLPDLPESRSAVERIGAFIRRQVPDLETAPPQGA